MTIFDDILAGVPGENKTTALWLRAKASGNEASAAFFHLAVLAEGVLKRHFPCK